MSISIWNSAIDLLFPPACVVCNNSFTREDQFVSLCDACFLRVRERPYTFRRLRFVDRLVSYGSYRDPLCRDIIHRFKYQGARSLARPLSQLQARALEEAGVERFYHGEKPLFTFIPLHPLKERFRGYNQSRLLAEELGGYFFSPVLPLLKRTGIAPAQASLANHRDRKKNIKGSFANLVSRVPQRVILVDDVSTSGATLEEAAKCLKKAGAKIIWGVTAAGR